jgi:hypothetical protein
MDDPSPNLAMLDAGQPGRSPEGTAMLAALSHEHIANVGRLGSGPALGPNTGILDITLEVNP